MFFYHKMNIESAMWLKLGIVNKDKSHHISYSNRKLASINGLNLGTLMSYYSPFLIKS